MARWGTHHRKYPIYRCWTAIGLISNESISNSRSIEHESRFAGAPDPKSEDYQIKSDPSHDEGGLKEHENRFGGASNIDYKDTHDKGELIYEPAGHGFRRREICAATKTRR